MASTLPPKDIGCWPRNYSQRLRPFFLACPPNWLGSLGCVKIGGTLISTSPWPSPDFER